MQNLQSAPICAAIDVGSNTIHVVVARCFQSSLDILADELEVVRIGESVTATGAISPEKCSASLRVLQEYRALAEQHGAECVFVVATEAIRQASNSADFISQVRAETGLEIQLISGTAEATLTFLGSTYEADYSDQIGVMDLGGGSLELVFARYGQIAWSTSIPIGSGWLHDRYLSGDPPKSAEIAAANAFLQTAFRHLASKQCPSSLIVTGGSANSLFYLVQEAFHRASEPRRLSLEDLSRCQGLLSALETKDISTLYGQPIARARILLAGTLLIEQMMRQLQLSEILVSAHGIREGVLLAYARFGEHWLDEVSRELPPDESFAESAHRMLVARLHTLLQWPSEVLKQEDIEAVHRMRVASRRLRATLDAYQSCCDPVLFAKMYRQVKATADALGDARDADVQIDYLQAQLAGLSEEDEAGVNWLIGRLQVYRQQKQLGLKAFLRKLDGEKLERLLRKSVQERRHG
jgi:exopolyphosphatase/pppGpp-phosphohydrolase